MVLSSRDTGARAFVFRITAAGTARGRAERPLRCEWRPGWDHRGPAADVEDQCSQGSATKRGLHPAEAQCGVWSLGCLAGWEEEVPRGSSELCFHN